MKTQSISLQRKLLKTSMLGSVLAGLIALVLLVGLSMYQTMSMQDEIMDEISDMLLVSDLSTKTGQQLDELSDEFEIQYQLKFQQQLLTQSDGFEGLSTQNEKHLFVNDHFSVVWLNHQLMRVYQANEDQQHVKLYQPLKFRFEKMLDSIVGYMGVLSLVWFFQWGMIYLFLKRQFKSIQRLSDQISKKSISDLSPVQQQQPEILELKPMISQLNLMLAKLESALVSEQRFTSDASHELRSPLSAIQMRLQVLKRKYASENNALDQDLQQIQLDVNRGTQVLENLLLLARLDPSDASALPQHHFSVDDVVRDVLQLLEPFAVEKNIHVQLQLFEVTMQGNLELIFTCIRNILDNAIRYSDQDGTIYVDLKCDKDIHLKVAQDGVWISDDVLARLGERFYRDLGTKTQGSGLGLSICKKIVDLHQGTIQFNRSEYGGLEVNIHLPYSKI